MAKEKKTKKNPVGRPNFDINWDEVGKYLEAGSPGTAIAQMNGIAPKTLYERCLKEHGVNFQEFSRQKRCKGDEGLRAKQYAEAMRGDRGMLIWLGKQRLGQKDKHDVEHSGKVIFEKVEYSKEMADGWGEKKVIPCSAFDESD